MKKRQAKVLIAATCAAVAIGALSSRMTSSQADSLLPNDNAVAGIAVALNNFYASSLNPQEEIKDFLEREFNHPEESQAEGTETTAAEELPAVEAPETEGSEPVAMSETETEPVTEAPVEEPSPYENKAITQVKSNVNIRKEPNTQAEIVGRIPNKAAADILETVDGEGGQWYRIKSGRCEGYMKAEFFVTGAEAEAIAKEVGRVWAENQAVTLRLREEPNTESRTLTMLGKGETYAVLQEGIYDAEGHEWIEVLISDGESEDDRFTGYLYKEYVEVTVEFDQAISVEEEREAAEEAERRKKEAEAAKKKLEEEKKKQEEASKNPPPAENNGSGGGQAPVAPPSNTGNATRDAIVARAMQFVGVLPYVYGGTSLTSGTDCSGFVYSIYREFGIAVPRDSRSQAKASASIDRGSLVPGDLVFYANSKGRINHVGIYIGGNKIVHNSNARTDVIVSSVDYMTPYSFGRIIN